jgi:hypothetical protein
MLAESGRLGKQLMRKSSKTEQAEAQEKTICVLSACRPSSTEWTCGTYSRPPVQKKDE